MKAQLFKNGIKMRTITGLASRAALAGCLSLLLLGGCSSDDTTPQPMGGDTNAVGATGADTSADGGSAGGGAVGVELATDVCGDRPELPLGAAESDGFVLVPPMHPSIRFSGRITCENDVPTFAYPGIQIAARFVGEGIDLVLRDSGKGTPQATNYYDITIDGGTPTLLEAIPGESTYELGRGLGEGEHTVEIFKRTESGPAGSLSAGQGEFLGLRIPEGGQLLPVLGTGRKLEFIGDSITCGYGNEVSTTEPDLHHFTSLGSSAHLAYGARTAARFGAEYMAVAYSGKGVSRNFGGGAGPTIPELYLKALPDAADSPVWEASASVPDAVIINLGTNDFSAGGVDRALYQEKYIEFLTTLRGYYPEAPLVLAIGPMISDFYPAGEKSWTSVREDLAAILATRQAAGDMNVHSLEFEPQSSPYGEDWHPTAATHEQMADKTVVLLSSLLGWTELH